MPEQLNDAEIQRVNEIENALGIGDNEAVAEVKLAEADGRLNADGTIPGNSQAQGDDASDDDCAMCAFGE